MDSIPDGVGQNLQMENVLDFSPNPVSARISVFLKVHHAGIIDLSVIDLTGKKVKTIHAGWVSSGKQSFEANLGNLNAGIYLLALKSNHASPVLMKLQKI